MTTLLAAGCITDKDVALTESSEENMDSAPGSTSDDPVPGSSTTGDPEGSEGTTTATTNQPPPATTADESSTTSFGTDGTGSDSGSPIDACEVDVEALPECALDECSQLFEFACPCEGSFEGAPDCFEFSEGCRLPTLECALPSPCERVFAVGWPVESYEDEAAATCVLEALRDGTPGSYELLFGGYMDDAGLVDVELFVGTDGATRLQYRDTCQGCPESGFAGRSGTLELREPAYFEACLTDPDVQSLTACLFGDLAMVAGDPPPAGWTPAFTTGSCSDLEWTCPQG